MEKLKKLATYISKQNVPLYAANASFFLILSVFPVLVILLTLMRYTGMRWRALQIWWRSWCPEH